MNPVIIGFLLPLLEKVLSLAAGPAETWVLAHLLKLIESHLSTLKINHEYSFSASITDETAGIVCAQISRGGQQAAVLVIYPLALTAAHQQSLAALAGVLFQDAEKELLGLFEKLAKSKA